jgi:S-formylglutathione hydrolase FrmB
MPDGGTNSWYWDSPVDPTYKYETFVSKELVEYIDSHYKTRADRTGRAITGLSMGGHGGLWLGIRHQDVYGAAGSTSGGVDIRPFPKNWGMSLRLGTIEQNPKNWDEYTVINQVHLLKPDAMKLIIDCGTEDFFYEVNCALHQKLTEAKIPHDFYTRPGVHNWDYWRNSIKYQVLFFSNYFKSANAAKQ